MLFVEQYKADGIWTHFITAAGFSRVGFQPTEWLIGSLFSLLTDLLVWLRMYYQVCGKGRGDYYSGTSNNGHCRGI
jgi:hypothetical protein